MKLSNFDIALPTSLIAQYPKEKRDQSRLMLINRDKKKITHHVFSDFPSLLRKRDVLVLNNSRVFPGQLHGYKEKTEADVVVTLLRELDPENKLWDVCVEPSRKIRVGNKICITEDLMMEVIDNTTSRCRTVKFCFQEDNEKFHKLLNKIGEPPLPNVIKRKVEEIDQERYQTIYAKEIGSVIPPSAGFHFTPYLLKYLEYKGVNIVDLTLHIGLNTFSLLNTEDLVKCKTHSEPFSIPERTVKQINAAIEEGKKVCAVGVSTLKALESSISEKQNLRARENSWTNKFISPPYVPRIANALLTGFHLPKSTDFISTLAFGGHDLMMKAYQIAIKEKYRFSVYGDVSLIV